jgi:hypothetical protein
MRQQISHSDIYAQLKGGRECQFRETLGQLSSEIIAGEYLGLKLTGEARFSKSFQCYGLSDFVCAVWYIFEAIY